MSFSPERTPYEVLGGEGPTLALARRFYDHMEQHEPALARLHRLTPEGRIDPGVRERFGSFLVLWLGGPDTYMREHGHPRLRMRHANVPIDEAMRDAWLRSMKAAMDAAEPPLGAELRTFLEQRFAEVADFLRNAR